MNIKSKLKSINAKTLIYLVLFNVFLLLLLWLIQVFFLSYSYEKYQVKNMQKIANEILEEDNNDLETIAYNNEICISYSDNYGNITIYNDKMPGCNLNRNNLTIIDEMNNFVISGKKQNSVKLVNQDYDVKALMYELKKDNNFIFLYSNLEDISKASTLIRGQLIDVTVIAIALSIVVSFYLSKKITRPILEITEDAKKLGEGNYKVEFKQNGITEIDQLADTLNHVKADLKKTDELRRDLMANVSHDLRTPLTMIKAYAEMIEDISYKDKKKLDEHVKIIVSETDRLNLLVNDILALSKMQAEADTLTKEKYDLVKEVKEIVSKYSIIEETKNYHIEMDLPKEVIIAADKNKINQVIYNLLNNAINYTGKDKTVKIKVTEEKKSYLVEIIDSGKGIDQKDIPFIWNKYYKSDKNHQRSIIGTGIGLSIVKEILEKHAFTYGVHSKKDKGSNFYFEIKKD